jgi:CubicO group peptidase (beta-lactamase class C family)
LFLSAVPGPDGHAQTSAFADARQAAAALPRLHTMIVSVRGATALEYYAKGAAATRATHVKSVSQLARDPDPRKARITIEDLLTMRSGLVSTSFDNYGSWVGSRNWIDYILSRPLEADPGTGMEYSTGNSHLLSAILTKTTSQSTWAFGQEALARPLGFTLSRWPRDPQGFFFGGNEMLMTPKQLLALGEIYLNRGRRGDRQLLPASWVDASCTGRGRSRFNPDQTYGYGWWLRDFAGRQGCFAWGYGGQYVIVFRDLGLIVVTTSSTVVSDERRDHRRQIFDIIERLILPAV